jgi:hypothetical protein
MRSKPTRFKSFEDALKREYADGSASHVIKVVIDVSGQLELELSPQNQSDDHPNPTHYLVRKNQMILIERKSSDPSALQDQ